MSDGWVLWQDGHGWALPLVFILGGLILGKPMERKLGGMVRRLSSENAWLSPETIARLFKGNISGLVTLGGFYLASFNLPLERPDVVIHIRKILFIGSMLIAIRFSISLALESIQQYARQTGLKNNFPNTSIFENLVRIGILVLGSLVILQTLGISVLPIVTALGVGGLAISLALQDTLANLFAGLHMILARQIKVGDIIQLEGSQVGEVKDIGWRTTTIKQLNGNLIILPNSKMASSVITNYMTPHPDLAVVLPVSIPLDSDLEKVESIAIEVAKTVGLQLYLEKHPKRKNEPFEPFVRYQSYGSAWVNMNIHLPFNSFMDAGQTRHHLLKALHQRFTTEGIHLPLPQHVVHLDSSHLDMHGLPIATKN
jgi:small-conductance mechanosensitive channel